MSRLLSILSLVMLLASGVAMAQPQVEASLDPKEILIGQPAKLTLTVKYHSQVEVFWPSPDAEIQIDSTRSIEVMAIDTPVTQQTEAFKAQRVYTITAWDTGYYIIPPFQVGYKVGKDDTLASLKTYPVLLTVQTVAVDTTQGITPIKDPMEAPFSWKEIIDELIIGLLIFLALAAVIVYFATRKKKEVVVAPPPKPADPAHVIALRKLDELDKKQMWQNGDEKGYHSGLTDILREYLELRFGFDAMESTTDEIVDRAQRLTMSQGQRENLGRIFRLADLVKFAKVKAYADEHKEAMMLARDFVTKTKKEDLEQYDA